MSDTGTTELPSQDDLPDRSVVVVGNGASLLNSGLGTWIDEHETVVRFNLFQTSRFAADAGTRTTVWFSNRDATSSTVKKMIREHPCESIYVHTWGNTARAAETFREELARLQRTTPVIPVERITLATMQRYLGESYTMFSTGAIGTWIMLQRYQSVTLAGFDWWNTPVQHHYCDRQTFAPISGRGHQPQLEKRFFEKLRAAQRLRWWTD